MATLKQKMFVPKTYIGWYGVCPEDGENACEPFKLISDTNEHTILPGSPTTGDIGTSQLIDLIISYENVAGSAYNGKVNKGISQGNQGIKELICGNAYIIVLKPGTDADNLLEFEIPEFVIGNIESDEKESEEYILTAGCGTGGVDERTPTPSPSITTSPTETPSPSPSPSPSITPSPTITTSPSPSPSATETPSPSPSPTITSDLLEECCEENMLTHGLSASQITSFGEPTITATGVTQNATICVGTPSGELPYTLKLIIDNQIVAVLTTTGTFDKTTVYYKTSEGECLIGSIVDDECVLSTGSSLNFSIEGSDIHGFEIKAILTNDSYLQTEGTDWVATTMGNELVISVEDTKYLSDSIASLQFFELSTIPNVSYDKSSCTIIDEELTFIYPIISEKLNGGTLLKCIASNLSSLYSQFTDDNTFNTFVDTDNFSVDNIIKKSENDEFAKNDQVNDKVSKKLTVLLESVKLQKNYSSSKSTKIIDTITDIKKSQKAFDVSQLKLIENDNFANSVNYLLTEISKDNTLEGGAFMSSLREHLNLPFQAINNMSNKAKEKLLEKLKNHSHKKDVCDLQPPSCCEDDMSMNTVINDTSVQLIEFENNANVTISGISDSAKNSEICFSEPDTTEKSLPFSVIIKKDNAILMVLTSVGELTRNKIYYRTNNICYSGIIDGNNECNLQ